jgi:hypothetical protein
MKVYALIRSTETFNFSVGESASLFMASEVIFMGTREMRCIE